MNGTSPYWINDGKNKEQIGKYVNEGDHFVDNEVKPLALDKLRALTDDDQQSFPKMLAASRADRRTIVKALYQALYQDLDFNYDNEKDFNFTNGQLLRLPSEIGNNPKKLGTCIDLAVLFLTCLANVKLWPIYLQVKVPGGHHALAGTWLDEPYSAYRRTLISAHKILEDMQKSAENRRFLFVDCTGFSQGVPNRRHKLSFADAQDVAKKLLLPDQILFALDIRKAWEKGFRPKQSKDCRIEPTQLPTTGGYFVDRKYQLRTLSALWKKGQTNVVQIVAFGGVGKTRLLKKWRDQLAKHDFWGAERVFDWSFYDQGTRRHGDSEKIGSADMFFDVALRWFEETEKPTQWKNAHRKGAHLAALIKQSRTLLLLDGLEPLQHRPGGERAGELIDPALRSLLQGLVEMNPGLCVITTREAVAELQDRSNDLHKVIDLELLDAQSAVQLLRDCGVTGSKTELEQAAEEYGFHALTLILLGTYLKQRCQGDVTRRHICVLDEKTVFTKDERMMFARVELLEGNQVYARRARRVIESYVRWIEQDPNADEVTNAELAILRLTGLFNRPIDKGCLSALLHEPIDFLTNALFDDGMFNRKRFELALDRLRKLRLLEETAVHDPHSLNCHPLIREHFSNHLNQERFVNAARDAHRRLYEHLKSLPNNKYPNNLNEMMPLYFATMHGCKARLHHDVFVNVFWPRIFRGKRKFSRDKLGALQQDLSLMACFMETQWCIPDKRLNAWCKAWVVTNAGLDLRLLGRLGEAEEPLRTGLEMFKEQIKGLQKPKDPKSAMRLKNALYGAANAGRHLAQLYVTQGSLTDAHVVATEAVQFAKTKISSPGIGPLQIDKYERKSTLTTLADVLHHCGRFTEAKNTILEAEEISPLSRLAHFRCCDLLISLDDLDEVENRAIAELEKDDFIVGKAVNLLLLGYVQMMKYADLKKAEEHFDEADNNLKNSDQKMYTIRAALWRSSLLRKKAELNNREQNLESSIKWLNSASENIEKSSMELYKVDVSIELAQVHFAKGETDRARKELETASQLAQDMTYARWKDRINDLSKEWKCGFECTF